MSDQDMISELEALTSKTSCQVCDALSRMSPQAADVIREALGRGGRPGGGSLPGIIGGEKLAAILTKYGYPTGKRAVLRHRSEGHS